CPLLLFFLILARPPTPTLFPYTTLFRSSAQRLEPSSRTPRSTLASLGGRYMRLWKLGHVNLRVSDEERARWFYCEVLGLKIAERSEEHTSELQSLTNLVCRLLLEKKKTK